MIDIGHRSDCALRGGWDCSCGHLDRVALATERTMHAAWRKRAEEAEAALAMAVRMESDRCARICEALSLGTANSFADEHMARLCAQTIRDGYSATLREREACKQVAESFSHGPTVQQVTARDIANAIDSRRNGEG